MILPFEMMPKGAKIYIREVCCQEKGRGGMSKDTFNKLDNERQQVFAVQISIWIRFALFFLSLIVGMAVDSIALILDASCSAAMLFGAYFARVAIKKLNKPPDEHYHFGYGKYEPLSVAIQNIVIIVTCVVGIKFAIQDIIHAESVNRFDIPSVAALIAGVVGLATAAYLKRVSRRTRSPIMKATSTQWYIDGALALCICVGFSVGFVLQRQGYTSVTPYIDPVMAIILGLIFIKDPARTVTSSMLDLLDAAPPADILKDVKNAVDTHMPKPFSVGHMRCRKAGSRIFLDMCFIIDRDMTVKEVRDHAKKFEEALAGSFTNYDIVVHYKHRRG